ncbi:hypothetical protein [Yersinia enterocolitica]|uniref:hypothetical protein n=1 Tax=Yersinia enterocolitica TaxID=630 RepID=UPI001C8EBB1B|nr:hypothetical protein [Yersinia enterocolitica]MBX9474927.1 hypothetical protein [Yersinia enterocolitica]
MRMLILVDIFLISLSSAEFNNYIYQKTSSAGNKLIFFAPDIIKPVMTLQQMLRTRQQR